MSKLLFLTIFCKYCDFHWEFSGKAVGLGSDFCSLPGSKCSEKSKIACPDLQNSSDPAVIGI